MKITKLQKVCLGTLAGSLFPLYFIIQSKINNNIQPYVESHLAEIIKNQEEKLGIKHFGIPKISYHLPPGESSWLTAGLYDQKKDEIYLPLGAAITPEKNFENTAAVYLSFGSVHNVKETLDHELGHFYVDKLSESLGRVDWLDFSDHIPTDDKIGTKLIAEGIAEYFKKTINNGKDDFNDSDFPKELKEFWTIDVIYHGGFHLVKPIIDRYGKKGIEHLILIPPTIEDLHNLPAYQSKIFNSFKSTIKE